MVALKRRLDIMECPPLGDPPVSPVHVQSKEVRTTTSDAFVVGGGREDERTYYLFDIWVPFVEPLEPSPQIQQPIWREMVSNNTIPCTISFLSYKGNYFPYVGSSSNGNLTLEPVRPPTCGLVGPLSQPLQNQHGMSSDPITDVSQPREDPFDLMNRELGVRGEGSSSNNTMTTSDGLRQETPPPPPTTP
ncbi:unnamed protein product [Microthlaspi erraticum]|uniref:Uncharacterized protein n=1 Tax=Microthlaspi erraticum TaxID=1685480 RepID=A0A6D2JMP8_9BRAS|nr:unnamed protein product [Microthlaspi erraticum]